MGFYLPSEVNYKAKDPAIVCFYLYTLDGQQGCKGQGPELSKIEIDINPECTAWNTQVVPYMGTLEDEQGENGVVKANITVTFDRPSAAAPGRAILRINKLLNSQGYWWGGPEVCLRLTANKGRPGACDNLHKLCAARGNESYTYNTCNLAFFGPAPRCCTNRRVPIVPREPFYQWEPPLPEPEPQQPPVQPCASRPPIIPMVAPSHLGPEGLCFSLGGYVGCADCCTPGPTVSKIQWTTQPGCSSSIQVTASLGLALEAPEGSYPATWEQNGTVLSLLTPGLVVDTNVGTRVCLRLQPLPGGAAPGAACDVPERLCAAPPGAPPGTCIVVVYGTQPDCCLAGHMPYAVTTPGQPVWEAGGRSWRWDHYQFVDREARWIWSENNFPDSANPGPVVTFHAYLYRYAPTRAHMHLMADATCDLFINGRYQGSAGGGFEYTECDYSSVCLDDGCWCTGQSSHDPIPYPIIPVSLAAGPTSVALRCSNEGTWLSPAGVLASLVEDGSRAVLLRSDGVWTWTESSRLESGAAGPLRPVYDLGPAAMSPWRQRELATIDPTARWVGASPDASWNASAQVVVLISSNLTVTKDTYAMLYMYADNAATLFINGTFVLTANGYRPSDYRVDGTFYTPVWLHPGTVTTITFRLVNTWTPHGSPSGLVATLVDMETEAPRKVLAHTDSSWVFGVGGDLV
ncbi:hypothetical protein HYH03_008224 [Edaphochlamys debaryana]|uniref:Pherophorin domain-containing protein n=1 Tax=Edaphochlamys debaryana TaxID=47281 RepID=A0A835Y0U8_9CHLO|nr:hypothetical protein HYH03_008224 [Edaphochlamys debaryana]|eukprot:KAG2493710.1 hypothetical protein HYH03_008224 [Edaphochlamys debaryana]